MLRLFALCLLSTGLCADAISQSHPVEGTRLDVDISGNVYSVDASKNVLRLYGRNYALLHEVGGPGWGDGQFDHPAGLWARNGIDVFVADYGNHRIERFDRQLNFVASFSTRDSDDPDVRFGYPTDVALSRLGDLFLCDGENSRIVKVNGFSTVERTFGGFGAGKGRLNAPRMVDVGPGDNVYVLDGSRVVIFDNFGNFIRELPGELFRKPEYLYADQSGVLVLDDSTLYCFDGQDRPQAAVTTRELLGDRTGAVRSFAASGDSLYVLTDSGLSVVRDPRMTAGDVLDKKVKTR